MSPQPYHGERSNNLYSRQNAFHAGALWPENVGGWGESQGSATTVGIAYKGKEEDTVFLVHVAPFTDVRFFRSNRTEAKPKAKVN